MNKQRTSQNITTIKTSNEYFISAIIQHQLYSGSQNDEIHCVYT